MRKLNFHPIIARNLSIHNRRYPNLNNQEKSGLSQVASTAQTIHGAIKTGKAIAAAAKGAAVGGPYGAAAGLALGAGRHAGKFLTAAAVLLMLPVLFILMLPSLIFGGLISSGNSGQPILNSYTRTSETRTVEDDDPDTEDVVETREETWYIYTLSYNGEGYFADTVFHLTDDQKALAGDYAQNLSLFLGDGMFQYTEYGGNTIASLGNVRFTDGATEVVYFNQLDERWANKPYGTDNIGGYGCGPTSMSIVVSSLTNDIVDPVEMAQWAYENGGWCSKSGSYHSLIPNAAKAWGLNVEGCTASEPQRIVDALSEGKLVVAIMLKGHFTSGGHFIVLRGVQDGKILVADPASYNRSQKLWDLSIILNEASNRAGAGGPFWIIGG